MIESAILVVALLGAAACPLHMWWASRRSRQPVCCPPKRASPEPAEALRLRQAELSRRIDELPAPERARV